MFRKTIQTSKEVIQECHVHILEMHHEEQLLSNDQKCIMEYIITRNANNLEWLLASDNRKTVSFIAYCFQCTSMRQ